MRPLALAPVALALATSQASAVGWVCTFDRDCVGGGACTPVSETINVSQQSGPVTLEMSPNDAQATGRATPMEGGRVLINATSSDGAMIMMNVFADGSSDMTLATMSGVRALFGTCQDAP